MSDFNYRFSLQKRLGCFYSSVPELTPILIAKALNQSLDAILGPLCSSGTVDDVAIWASYQIRKIAGCACAGNAGNVFPRRRFQRELLVSDPGMHHGTCVTHVPWCMSGSLTCGDGENVPGIPGACAPAILRIWQEAHGAIMVLIKFMPCIYAGGGGTWMVNGSAQWSTKSIVRKAQLYIYEL